MEFRFKMVSSLNLISISDQISLCYRQNPNEPNGFYGLKDNILMAKSNDENFKPDWDKWSKINRTKLQEAAVKESIKNEIPELREKQEDDAFDTTISGPWMHNWPIVHHNRHTAKLTANFSR